MLLSGVLLASACGEERQAPPTDRSAEARAAVAGFFEAARGGDCGALKALMSPKLSHEALEGGCETFFASDPLARTRDLEIGKATRDGRDHDAYMIRVSMSVDGVRSQTIVRVETDGKLFRVTGL